MTDNYSEDVAHLLRKPTLTVRECATVLRVGKNACYEMARTGQLRVLRVGKRIVVPSSAVRELLGDS